MAAKKSDDLLPETVEVVALVTIHTGGGGEGFKPGSRLTLGREEAEELRTRGLVAYPGDEIIAGAGKAGSFAASELKKIAGGGADVPVGGEDEDEAE